MFDSAEDVFDNKDEKCYQVTIETLEKEFFSENDFDFKCTNNVIKDVDDLEFAKLIKKINGLQDMNDSIILFE